MKIYQVWDQCDAAETDNFYATKREATKAMQDHKSPEMRVLVLENTKRATICRALKFWPMR